MAGPRTLPGRKANVRPSRNMDAEKDKEKDEDPSSVPSTAPVDGAVTMEPLMFYKICYEIAKPIRLVPKNSETCRKIKMGFIARREDFDDILKTSEVPMDEKMLHMQLRFCLWQPQRPQIDHLPRHVNITVNRKKHFVLREKESNQRPINITDLVHFSDVEHNIIKATWSLTDCHEYGMSICWVKQLTVDDLLRELRAKDVFPADKTRALILEKLAADGEDDPAPSSLRISLTCPLGLCRMSVPCRLLSCFHLQTFDAVQYLKCNENKETWKCPICIKKSSFRNLVVDEFFLDILNSTPDHEEIEFLPDGSWYPITPRKDRTDDSNDSDSSSLPGVPEASGSEIPVTAPMESNSSNVEVPATTEANQASVTTIVARRCQHLPELFRGPLEGRNQQHSRSPLGSPEPMLTRVFPDLNFTFRRNLFKPTYNWTFAPQSRCDYGYSLPWRPVVRAPATALGPVPAPIRAPALFPAPALAPRSYSGWLPPPLHYGIYPPGSQQLSLQGLWEMRGRGRDDPTLQPVARYQTPPLIPLPRMVQIVSPTVAMVSTLGRPWRGTQAMSPILPTYVASADPRTGAIFTQAGRASASRVNVGQSVHAGGIVSTQHSSNSGQHRCQ
ncbi:E3 SUMO-protein ligase PIAS3-like isoform X2 [Tachyglossus aculeatus]|uniref:E3 SUMO-protein ligase PIAS3-like isoform X2 n=1 Tax=Tachyglossus aculeatus TaxID=9261 RepID=UPI0018F70C58|nr:E3 SUMO-protein ligase PIAS3-like isoform X2 [Tachyglossus aculeatus]